MSIEELRVLRAKLEKDILNLISEFEANTTANVNGIELSRTPAFVNGNISDINIACTVEVCV
jgi:hypothetical protein